MNIDLNTIITNAVANLVNDTLLEKVTDAAVSKLHGNEALTSKLVGTLMQDTKVVEQLMGNVSKVLVRRAAEEVAGSVDEQAVCENAAEQLCGNINEDDVMEKAAETIAENVDADDVARAAAEALGVDEDSIARAVVEEIDTDNVVSSAAEDVANRCDEDAVVEHAAEIIATNMDTDDVAQAVVRRMRKANEDVAKALLAQVLNDGTHADVLTSMVRAEVARVDAVRRAQPMWRRVWQAIVGA